MDHYDEINQKMSSDPDHAFDAFKSMSQPDIQETLAHFNKARDEKWGITNDGSPKDQVAQDQRAAWEAVNNHLEVQGKPGDYTGLQLVPNGTAWVSHSGTFGAIDLYKR